jgi:hypothetical protein
MKSVGALTQVLSVNDRGAISPYTKRPLCLSEMRGTNWDDEDAPITLATRDDVQSRNEAYPLTVMLGSETKVNMEHLGENYNILTKLGADASVVNVAYKPFYVTHKGDMSLQWKITKKGCATKKGNDKFCMCCTCKGKDMHKPMEILCGYCDGRVSLRFKPMCHHHKVNWEEIEKYKLQSKYICERLQTEIGSFDKTECHYTHHDPTRADDGMSGPLSINFVPTSLAEGFEVMNHIQDDLIVRGMKFEGDLDELCLLLIERLQMEHDLNELQDAIMACAPHADAFVNPAKLIPCSLNLEIRMGLKMSTMILAEGPNSYMVKSDQVKFIEKIVNIVNEENFGNKDSPSSWNFPSAKADGESTLLVMGDVCLTNNKVQCLIPNINKLIDLCMKDNQRNGMARDCLAHYRNALNIVTCPRKYTNMELWTFQDESHEYGWRWIKLYGLAGCTHCVHVFMSHLLHYMTKYECLHRYSQQGWEH